jgi:Fic family protein
MRQVYSELDKKTAQLKDILKKQHRTDEFQRLIDMSWVHHDSALEGVVYSQAEINAALENRILADVSHLSTYQEIRNHVQAINDVREAAKAKKVKISIDWLKSLHGRLVYLNDDAVPGRYRKDIPIHRTYFHDIALPNKISYQLSKALELIAGPEVKDFHPLKLACWAHFHLMQVFPFSEHSGKIARLVMNQYLVHSGYFPVIIHSSDRQRYYETLKGPPQALKMLALESMDNALNNAIKFVTQPQDTSHRAAN